jgi:pimeloyl-ACP methyl ester carboxylesterase
MLELTTPHGIRVTYAQSGSGPPLLVHGGFSDHHSNWEFVEPILRDRFTLYAIARRNRGGTTATRGHSVVDEADAHLTVLHGQAHEGMTTAPEQYAAAVSAFLSG